MKDHGPIAPIPVREVLVLVLGPPGAGKTTIARALSTQLNSPLMVTSQFLREMTLDRANSALARTIQQAMARGENIDEPDVNRAILDKVWSMRGMVRIVDGFPRTTGGAAELERWSSLHDMNLVFLHVFAGLKMCRSRFHAKASDNNWEHIFDRRMEHYSQVERQILARFSHHPVLNVLN